MKAIREHKKMDLKLIIVAVLAIILFIVADIFAQSLKKSTIDQVDLPEHYQSISDQLIINEIMTNNAGVYVNSKNEITDYVELYNGTGEDINLKGYGLSDKEDKIKYVFDDVTIKAYGYYTVSLSGTRDPNCANFKLSAKGGEKMILTNPASKIIDSVETVFLGKNEVMIRTGKNVWSVSSLATPGFENSIEGKNSYEESLFSDEESKIIINELLISNKGNYINENGRMDGFVEIKNVSEEIIDLSEYTISNTMSLPFRKQLDKVTLLPGEIYTIYCGDGDYLHQNYLGFNFANKEGSIIISHNGKIIQKLDYSAVANGQSYCFDGESYYATASISPNQKNTAEGVDAFQKEYLKNPNSLIINEVMNNNSKYLAQNGTNYYDWIELYNNGSETINLSDYYISLSDDNFLQCQLPDVELQAGQYYVVMCSGEESFTNDKYLHTGFKLGEYEAIYLSTKDQLIDCIFVGDVPANYSIGKGSEYGVYYMDSPTPAAKNNAGKQTIARQVIFSVPSGIYNNVSSLSIELSGDGSIRYTTDGSEPTSSSKVYTGPIKLTKTTVIKAKCFNGDSYASELFTQSYIINENHTMDVVSVSLNPDDFSYINKHYSVSYNSNAENATRYASIELLTNDGDGFNAKCSISVGGGYGKTLSKKSYTIRFNKAAGQSDLKYQVFENRDCYSYDTLFLRSASSDYNDTLIKDILAASLVDDYTNIDTQAYRPVILYVNGEYWGIYTIREKINEHFIEDHYNVETDDLSIVESGGYAKYGSYNSYNELRKYCRTHNLATQEYYDYVCSKIDVEAWVDYWVCELYTNNYDLGNVRYFSSPYINDGKFTPIFYDIDHGFHSSIIGWEKTDEAAGAGEEEVEEGEEGETTPAVVTTSYDMWNIDFYSSYLLNGQGMGLYHVENDIIRALFENASFKTLWYERMAYHLNNTFSTTNVINRINEIYNIYKPEISRDAREWGYSVSNWEYAITELRNWAKNRPARLVNMTASHFGMSSATKSSYFKGLY